MWINSNGHFKLNRIKKEQFNSRRIDGNRKIFPCALENSAINSASWFLTEKKKKVRKIHCLLGRIKSHRKHEWIKKMYRMYYFVNDEWNILICWSWRRFITLRFHFLYTAGDPLFQKHWSTKWVSKSLKWLKKKWNWQKGNSESAQPC